MKIFSSKSKNVLPGFRATLGFTIFYLTLLVLIPLSMLFWKTAGLSWHEFWQTVTAPRVLASFRLSFGASLGAALINAFFGLLLAWVLVRYRFPGRSLVDMLIDLPFALPTAVAGIALTTAFSGNGLLGRFLEPLGLKIVFTPVGIMFALVFIGLPFVVRSVQPVLKDLDRDIEEAAACLGAKRRQTFFQLILPSLFPALLSGFTMAFARALGEYGSVIFIAGNLPMKTEIAPLVIMTKLEQYDYAGATAVAVVMLVVSFFILLIINRLQTPERV
jgi:sulfate transport system permease protein